MDTLITAHSGCESTLQDSMESVELAIEFGADAIEMDVRRADGGLLYISHDRKCGNEILEKISLESVFERIKDTSLKFNCDIKEPFALPGTLDMARHFGFGPDRLILTGSVSPEQLAHEPAITERASIYINIEEALKFFYMKQLYANRDEASFPKLMTDAKPFVLEMMEDDRCIAALIRMTRTLNVCGINMPHQIFTKELAERFHTESIACSVWTVNEYADADRCLALGAENITTRAVRTVIERRRISTDKKLEHKGAKQ